LVFLKSLHDWVVLLLDPAFFIHFMWQETSGDYWLAPDFDFGIPIPGLHSGLLPGAGRKFLNGLRIWLKFTMEIPSTFTRSLTVTRDLKLLNIVKIY
jgi:hypothetical protein